MGSAHRRREAIADGWSVVPSSVRAWVAAVLRANTGMVNTTANQLGVSRAAIRRVMSGFPSRPDEAVLLERAVSANAR